MTPEELEAIKISVVRRVREAMSGDLKDVRDDIASNTGELVALRAAVDALGTRLAVARVAAAAPDAMTATGRHAAINLANAESALAGLSFWKARPALLMGFVASAIALLVGFGLPITGEQKGLIMAFVSTSLAVVASMRGRQTTTAAIAAASLAVAPESQAPAPVVAARMPSSPPAASPRNTYGGRPRPPGV